MPTHPDHHDLPDPRDCLVARAIAYDELRRQHATTIDHLAHLLAFTGKYRTYGLQAIDWYLEYVNITPASARHHQAHAGGHIEHTLEVAVDAFSRPDAPRSRKKRFMLLLAILLHDVGKVAQMETRAVGSELIWDFESGTLTDWIEAHEITEVSFTWNPEHMHDGCGSTEPISLLLQRHILRAPLRQLLTIAEINELLACQIRDLIDQGLGEIGSLLRASDHSCTQVRWHRHPLFYADFVADLASGIEHGRGRPQGPGQDVFMSPSHTVMALPHEHEGQLYGQVWQEACLEIVNRYGAPDVAAVTDLLLGDRGYGFMRKQGSGHGPKAAIFHAGVDRLMPSVIIPNRCFTNLLGTLIPDEPSAVPLRIEDLHRTKPCRSLSDLGFPKGNNADDP